MYFLDVCKLLFKNIANYTMELYFTETCSKTSSSWKKTCTDGYIRH